MIYSTPVRARYVLKGFGAASLQMRLGSMGLNQISWVAQSAASCSAQHEVLGEALFLKVQSVFLQTAVQSALSVCPACLKTTAATFWVAICLLCLYSGCDAAEDSRRLGAYWAEMEAHQRGGSTSGKPFEYPIY